LPRISAGAEARNISTMLAARSLRVCDPGLELRLAFRFSNARRMASVFDSLVIAATSAASLSTSSFFRLRAIVTPLHQDSTGSQAWTAL
jgi:hypothetical protein